MVGVDSCDPEVGGSIVVDGCGEEGTGVDCLGQLGGHRAAVAHGRGSRLIPGGEIGLTVLGGYCIAEQLFHNAALLAKGPEAWRPPHLSPASGGVIPVLRVLSSAASILTIIVRSTKTYAAANCNVHATYCRRSFGTEAHGPLVCSGR